MIEATAALAELIAAKVSCRAGLPGSGRYIVILQRSDNSMKPLIRCRTLDEAIAMRTTLNEQLGPPPEVTPFDFCFVHSDNDTLNWHGHVIDRNEVEDVDRCNKRCQRKRRAVAV